MFLGLDLGTSGLRALLLRPDGSVVGASDSAYEVSHPNPGWSEQNPNDWITGCRSALAELRQQHPSEYAQVLAIGVSGQMHGAVVLGANDAPLRPCILWNDTRSHVEAERLNALPDVPELSGNIVFPGFTAPKLVWLAANEPDVFASTHKVLLPKGYLVHWLTGRHICGLSDAAGTSWLDTRRREWSQYLLDASGMRLDQMPDLVEGNEVVGAVRGAVADELGLSRDVKVVGGAGDNAAAACGVGAIREGDGFVSLGTSGVLLAARDGFAPSPDSAVHTFCHAFPKAWYQMGVILAATDSLNWLSRVTGQTAADLAGGLGDKIGPPGDIRFLPYLSGERTPHNDSHVRGAFIGLDISAGPTELAQAVMEGVAFALRDNFEALKSTGAQLDRILAIGGGSQSRYWVEVIATVLGQPINLPQSGEFGAALGAARLAMAGATGASVADVMTPTPVAESILPRADLQSAYEDAWAKFAASYSPIRSLQ